MVQGAVVLVDCLGFKGIWKRMNANDVLRKLTEIENVAQSTVTRNDLYSKLPVPVECQIRLLSDTVAVIIHPKSPTTNPNVPGLVDIACKCAAQLCRLFAVGTFPLMLRGCIAFGEHAYAKNFLVGPAVDEAATYMNDADGSFIWLLPTAAEQYRADSADLGKTIQQLPTEKLVSITKASQEHLFQPILSDIIKMLESGNTQIVEHVRRIQIQMVKRPLVIESYPVPMKNAGIFDATVVNPFAASYKQEDHSMLLAAYQQALIGETMDVWRKRQHTMKFISLAYKLINEHQEAFAALWPLMETFLRGHGQTG